MKNYLTDISINPPGETFSGPGTLGSPGANAGIYFASFISGLIGLLTIIAGLFFLFNIFTGAIGIISSGGDPKSLEGSRNKILYGIIGIIVVVSAIFIVDFAGSFLGFSVLNPIEYLINIPNGLISF